eukprot:TRINITY_DN1060_c0_g1_i1.p1 TRINITY_DN1060_c0_g1~~TRINITY_DN1060_c0_g1_i1.p1  ORF type:complete len:618 (+),score=168.22 TRINITY_DN1060_c0_g1_i1:44-1897(+)
MDSSDWKLFQIKILKDFERAARKNEAEFGKLRAFAFRDQDPSLNQEVQSIRDHSRLRNSSSVSSVGGDVSNTRTSVSASDYAEVPQKPIEKSQSDHAEPNGAPVSVAAEPEIDDSRPSEESQGTTLRRTPSNASEHSHESGSGSSSRSSLVQVNELNEFNETRKQALEFLESEGLTFSFLKDSLIDEQTKIQSETHLFREEGGIGIPLLVHLWNAWEGLTFFREVIEPVVIKISKYDFPLEIDPLRGKKGGLRKNLEILLPLVTEVLEGTYKLEQYISAKLLELFRTLNYALSRRFREVKMGGLICLRLICPMIISPELFNKDLKFDNYHTRRSCVLLAKILQKLGNASGSSTFEGSVILAERFLRRNTPKWNAFFHKLMTGEELIGSKTNVLISEADFAARSTIDLSPEQKSNIEPLLAKQNELIKELLHLEMQTGWECKPKTGFNIYFKVFKDTGRVLAKAVVENINADIENVLEWTKKNKWLKDACPSIDSTEIAEVYSDNLRIIRHLFSTKALLSRRECVLLEFSDLLPEEKFGVFAFSPIEHEKFPITSKYIRSDLFGGIVLRGKADGRTDVTFLYHVDAKGWVGKAPQSLLKMGCKTELNGFMKTIIKAYS